MIMIIIYKIIIFIMFVDRINGSYGMWYVEYIGVSSLVLFFCSWSGYSRSIDISKIIIYFNIFVKLVF